MNEGFEKDQIDNLSKRELIYVKRFNRFTRDQKEYDSILIELKNHIFNNFHINDKGYIVEIIPDNTFLELINKLNNYLEDPIILDKIQLFITKGYNLIDLETFLPDILKGCSIGYKIYKLMTNHFGYISSNKYASEDAINLWYNLLQDDDFYCLTSNHFSYLINKKISDINLREILKGIKCRKEVNIDQISFDDDLILKINEIFGSFNNFLKNNYK